MALSATDKSALSQEQQDAISGYTAQYNAAKASGDSAAMAAAHQAAEQVRATKGYSGGAGGTQNVSPAPAQTGGYSITPTKTADQMGQHINDYRAQNGNAVDGYTNGFSGVMNGRSEANAIRQQMLENTKNWWNASDQATKDYLHQQNVQLNQLLTKATGGAVSNYNAATGEWTTNNGNLGYGKLTYDPAMLKNLNGQSGGSLQGYSDADIAVLYKNQSGRYNNYVDYSQVRNAETPGNYTGQYANGSVGPLSSLMMGTARDPSGGIRTPSNSGNVAPNTGDGRYAYVDQNGIIQAGSLSGRQHPGQGMNGYYLDQAGSGSGLGTGSGSGLGTGSGSGLGTGSGGGLGTGSGSGLGTGTGGSSKAAGNYPTPSGSGSSLSSPSGMESVLSKWLDSASQQATNGIDYATNKSVKDLQKTQEDAAAKYQTERNQVSADEQRGLDNSALYAEMRGDRGGIGQAQYNSIQNTAAINRQTVNGEQTKLATDTQRQITDLRAQGEYDKADKLLEISQNYLSQLISLEEWAAQYNLSVDQFNESVRQWQAEFELSAAQVTGSYNGSPTLAAQAQSWSQQQDTNSTLSSAGDALLKAGIMPSNSQLAAMGMTKYQAQSYVTAAKLAASTKSSGSSGSSGSSKSSSSSSSSSSGEDYDGLYAAAYASKNPANYIAENYKKYGFTKTTGLSAGYKTWKATPVSSGQGAVYKVDYSTLAKYTSQVLKNHNTAYAYDALKTQGYSDAVIDQVFASLGK